MVVEEGGERGVVQDRGAKPQSTSHYTNLYILVWFL